MKEKNMLKYFQSENDWIKYWNNIKEYIDFKTSWFKNGKDDFYPSYFPCRIVNYIEDKAEGTKYTLRGDFIYPEKNKEKEVAYFIKVLNCLQDLNAIKKIKTEDEIEKLINELV